MFPTFFTYLCYPPEGFAVLGASLPWDVGRGSSQPRCSARPQRAPGICGAKPQGKTKMISGNFAALSANPEKQKV